MLLLYFIFRLTFLNLWRKKTQIKKSLKEMCSKQRVILFAKKSRIKNENKNNKKYINLNNKRAKNLKRFGGVFHNLEKIKYNLKCWLYSFFFRGCCSMYLCSRVFTLIRPGLVWYIHTWHTYCTFFCVQIFI